MQLVEKTGRGEVGESKGRKAAGGKEPGAGPAGHPHPPPQTPAHFTLTGPRSVLTCRSHRHLCFSQCCTISRLGKHTFQTFIEGTDKNAEENRVNAWAMSRSRGLPLGCERHRITLHVRRATRTSAMQVTCFHSKMGRGYKQKRK